MVAATAALVLLAFAATASAAADSINISVSSPTIAAGQSTKVTVSGNSTSSFADLYAYFGPASTFVCGSAPPQSDSGYSHLALDNAGDGTFVSPGAYNDFGTITASLAKIFGESWDGVLQGPPGSYVICGYLVQRDGQTLATGTATFHVRLPHDSVVLPRKFQVSHGVWHVRFGYRLEPGSIPVDMYVAVFPKFRVGGHSLSCTNTSVRANNPNLAPNGGFVTLRTPVSSTGSYGVCAMIFDPSLGFKLATASGTIVTHH